MFDQYFSTTVPSALFRFSLSLHRSVSNCISCIILRNFWSQPGAGLPLFLLSLGCQTIAFFRNLWSVILWACPYHISCCFSTSPIMLLFTIKIYCIISFLTPSITVFLLPPHKSISMARNFFFCCFDNCRIFTPYRTTLYTIILYVFSFVLLPLSHKIKFLAPIMDYPSLIRSFPYFSYHPCLPFLLLRS